MAAARGIGRALSRSRGVVGRDRALSSGRAGGSEDFDVSRLLADAPPSSSRQSNAASSEPRKGSWESLMREPAKEKTPEQWDFLQDLDPTFGKRSQPRSLSSPSSSSSFRKLANSGLDFLSEEVERPASPRNESASVQQEPGEGSLLNTPSFKLIRDSFYSLNSTRDTDKKALDEKLGLDSSYLFSSTEIGSKEVDIRTLAEVEGNFYSTADQFSIADIKTYTYEELGEILRKARPPKEQILSSATGLSFGELRIRFQKIDQEEREARGDKESVNPYVELKESLDHLRPLDKRTTATKELSYEELAFLNQSGLKPGRVRIEYTPPNDDLLTKYYSEAQLTSKERLKLEIKKLKEVFQTHEYDTGSPQVQIAILTARINNLNRHMREGPNYKRDKHSKKGLNDMVQYRKRLLRYLRRRDWSVYCNVLTKLKLDDVILEKRR